MNAWPLAAQKKVLIAEDDLDLLGVIGLALHNAGFEVTKVTNGADALKAVSQQVFSLLVLDINMPQVNGLEVCAKFRATSNVPVMMLSARDQERDLLDALDVGADAYILKPFSPRALIARIGALLRRSMLNEPRILQVGQHKLDLEGLTLTLQADTVTLTKLETRLLRLLMSNPGLTVTSKTLIDEIWDTYSTANRNMLKQVIYRLRRKLLHDPVASDCLRTTPEGYAWHSPITAASVASLPA
jgi:Response regulators consisting of a CheY-like receiver domain and a winged-helix DNA-binding domain